MLVWKRATSHNHTGSLHGQGWSPQAQSDLFISFIMPAILEVFFCTFWNFPVMIWCSKIAVTSLNHVAARKWHFWQLKSRYVELAKLFSCQFWSPALFRKNWYESICIWIHPVLCSMDNLLHFQAALTENRKHLSCNINPVLFDLPSEVIKEGLDLLWGIQRALMFPPQSSQS